MNKTNFALFFGNRGFFPASLIAGARAEMKTVLERLGYGVLMMDENATRHGAVETVAEGAKYATFLADNRGKYDGVILCLPNFGDETGAVAALQDCGVPILVHAYPDELDKMSFAHRRDSFCGKFSIMDVFYQYGVKFTTFKPHAVAPASDKFAQQLAWFAAVCRVVNGMKRMTVGAIGARTTPFKTVRFDEITLQKYGITTETLDMSEIISRVRAADFASAACAAKARRLQDYTDWSGVPDEAFRGLVKLGVVLDEVIDEYAMQAISIRCWLELQKEIRVSPCVILSELNDRGIAAACELDVCNAVAMHALTLASGKSSTCLDWNNNYGEEEDKCILFHCGPVPQSLMKGKGHVIEQPMFAKTLGTGCGYGCNAGRIASFPMTFTSSKTENGKLCFYLSEGEMTADPVPEDFFGCAGVAEIPDLQEKLHNIGLQGFRHHVGLTSGLVAVPLREAMARYLGYEIAEI